MSISNLRMTTRVILVILLAWPTAIATTPGFVPQLIFPNFYFFGTQFYDALTLMLYFQAIEFVAFHIKLKNSSQYLISKLDSFILNLKISANNLDELEVNFLC